MSAQAIKIETIRKSLIGDLFDFVTEAGFERQQELHLVADFVHRLSDYRDESISFFPNVYLLRRSGDLQNLNVIAPGAERIGLSHVSLSDDAASTILKDSAPLATRGWSVIVEVNIADDIAHYGIFRSEQLPFSLSSAELLADPSTATGPAILLRNCSANSVELIAGTGSTMEFTLTSAKPSREPMSSCIDLLTTMVVAHVSEAIKNPFHSYMKRTLGTILQQCHGTIIGVVKADIDTIPESYKDGIILAPPVSLASAFESLQNNPSAPSLVHLSSLEAILRGMIQCDGITLLASDGSIRAFRVFVKPTPPEQAALQDSTIKGGARSRAFHLMKHRLGDLLTCAFFRSQDGKMECRVTQ